MHRMTTSTMCLAEVRLDCRYRRRGPREAKYQETSRRQRRRKDHLACETTTGKQVTSTSASSVVEPAQRAAEQPGSRAKSKGPRAKSCKRRPALISQTRSSRPKRTLSPTMTRIAQSAASKAKSFESGAGQRRLWAIAWAPRKTRIDVGERCRSGSFDGRRSGVQGERCRRRT